MDSCKRFCISTIITRHSPLCCTDHTTPSGGPFIHPPTHCSNNGIQLSHVAFEKRVQEINQWILSAKYALKCPVYHWSINTPMFNCIFISLFNKFGYYSLLQSNERFLNKANLRPQSCGKIINIVITDLPLPLLVSHHV